MADSNKKTKFDFKVSKMRLIWYNPVFDSFKK